MENQIIKLKGSVIHIGPEQKFTEKFKKRDLVIGVLNNFEKIDQISLQVSNDKCDLLNNLSIGDEVETCINITGREWVSPDGTKKWFNTLNAWSIQLAASPKVQNSFAGTDHQKTVESNISASISSGPIGEDDDDLPF